MSANLASKIGTGLKPQQFMDGMTKNQEQFLNGYNAFQWDNEEDKEFFESLNNRDDLRCIIVAADWCGDAVRNVPVVFKALENSGVPVEVLILEENYDVIDQFLTAGGRSIPIIIFTDTGGFTLGHWGPRPAHVQAVMMKFKAENPDREAADFNDHLRAAREEMGRQYGEDNRNHAVVVKELRELISTF